MVGFLVLDFLDLMDFLQRKRNKMDYTLRKKTNELNSRIMSGNSITLNLSSFWRKYSVWWRF